MTQIPTVQTERLTLRAWRPDDFDPYAELCADPAVMRYIFNGATLPYDAAVGQAQRFCDHWVEHGFGLWAVQERDSGAFIGFAGLVRPYFMPEVMPAVELGWRFAQPYWGRGYATESGRAALKFGFEHVDLNRVIGIAQEPNRASWHVMTKLGMTLDRKTSHPGIDTPVVVYAVERSAFSAD